MKLDVDFSALEMLREQMEGLYRSPDAARATGYGFRQVTRSVDGRSPRTFWLIDA